MRRRPRASKPEIIKTAQLRAAGVPAEEIAKARGVSTAAVYKATRAVLTYEAFEDIRNCRMVANARLDELADVLREVAGLQKINKTVTKNGKLGTPSERGSACRALVDLEKRRAEMFGYDAPKRMEVRDPDPLENMTPEEVLAACQQLNIPVPPGLADECRRRAELAKRSESLEAATRGAESPRQ